MFFSAQSPAWYAASGGQIVANLPWRVLVVDDEPDVHAITRIVLRDTVFEDRPVEFLDAYSAQEARQTLLREPDIAIAIVDVVMETDDAGLRLAQWIREDLQNSLIRIILRTGRPGEAPERSVIIDYDINDYREKSELTDSRLLTMLISALRGYRDLHNLDLSRRGFARIAQASGDLFRRRSIADYFSDVIVKLAALVASGSSHSTEGASGVAIEMDSVPVVISGVGEYESTAGSLLSELREASALRSVITHVRNDGLGHTDSHTFAGCYPGAAGNDVIVIIRTARPIGAHEHAILSAFSANVSLAFENLTLSRHIEDAQREMIYMLGEAVERRSSVTGSHVKRMARIVGLLARKLGIPEDAAQVMELGAPLHDIGKIAIPDQILNKPARLTDDEMDLMRTHAMIGFDILKPHTTGMLRQAAEIALTHHERWQGQGYPGGLAGENIPLPGRISAVADVFDALSVERPYKPSWPIEEAFAFVREQSGVLFDPRIAQILLDSRDEVIAIYAADPDA